MKYARAYAALILATAFLASCATRPPAQEKPYLVQLSATPSDGSCDWSLLQDVSQPPVGGYLSLGSAEWPRAVPVDAAGGRRIGNAPLQTFGAKTGFQWSSKERSICLPLSKRTSVWQEGVPPILTLELRPEGAETRALALTSNLALAKVTVLIQASQAGSDFAPHRLDLDFRDGRAEARFLTPPNGQWLSTTVVATEIGGEAQTERAVVLVSTPESGGSLIVREGSRLVARPSWPGAGRRSSRPR
ncbi:hypothetical protein [uncultured Brevundimonas sp.]|uniref:hypothetical protein n=1 Tax=uncultured Brevundimonas sp. TaxID=213418 RepID=UPI0025E95467|nr:hypothetical protein [uncultured Brevundimonas sp.]